MAYRPWPAGDRLWLERHRRGWTQARVARETGLSKQTVAAIEQGRSRGGIRAWAKIADVFGLTFDELCDTEAMSA